MLNQIFTIASKEVTDSWRDRRGLTSAALYSLMGPGVVGLVSLGVHDSQPVLLAMMSIFTMVSAFVGGMNVAMDSIAGERERRSLLPLLMHPVSRLDLLLGKWLAVAAFSAAGLSLNVLGFALLLHRAPRPAIRRCRRKLAATRFGIWLYFAEMIFCLTFLYRDPARREPLPAIIFGVATPLFLVGLARYRRKTRAELDDLLKLQRPEME